MSARKQSAIVSRDYRPAPDYCTRALELLLKKPVIEGSPAITAPDDAKVRSVDDSRASKAIIPE
jgi:hypothetical protein